MDNASLKFLDVPENPLQNIYQERVTDWKESQDHINALIEKHHEKYRQRVCTKCTNEQKIKRNCAFEEEFDSNGNLKTCCNHMSRAGYQKYQDIILKSMDFHPLFFNPE